MTVIFFFDLHCSAVEDFERLILMPKVGASHTDSNRRTS